MTVVAPGEPDAGRGPATAPGSEPEPPLEWTVNPWRQRPLAAAVALLAPVALTLLVAPQAPYPLVLAALAIALLVSLRAALLVAHCRVDRDGLSVERVRVTERLPWARIRRARVTAAFVWATSEPLGSWRAAFRGLGLALPAAAAERERLVPELQRRLALHGF